MFSRSQQLFVSECNQRVDLCSATSGQEGEAINPTAKITTATAQNVNGSVRDRPQILRRTLLPERYDADVTPLTSRQDCHKSWTKKTPTNS